MDPFYRSGLILLGGMVLLISGLAIHGILLETVIWTLLLIGAGALLCAWGAYSLRAELGQMLRRRRGEIALYTLGTIGVLIALGYFTMRYPARFDMTEAGLFSLSPQTITMLERLERPVRITFFHDPLMRETVELYELMADQTDKVTVDFHDPTLNPAQARMMGVQFAGTSVMESDERRLQVHGATETDIANGILRVSQGAKQLICFMDGHGEADPFSMESHDHVEGAAGHSHGLGAQYVLHERHGLAKARHGLETTNYVVEEVSPTRAGGIPQSCAVLVVAGPKVPLLPVEVRAVRTYLAAGGNAFFMLDPFVETGLEPLLGEYGVVLDTTIVIDDASHFWSDVSAPAVTNYNSHPVTLELPLTFFPGARSLSPTSDRVPGTSVSPLVQTSGNSYGETNQSRAEFDTAEDVSGPVTLMVISNKRWGLSEAVARAQGGGGGNGAGDPAASRGDRLVAEADQMATGTPSRIAVVGDSDFATNSFFHFLGNGNLFLNTVSYLSAQENLIGIEPRTYDLPRLSLTNRQMKGTFVLSVILVPAALAVIGFAVWWKQR